MAVDEEDGGKAPPEDIAAKAKNIVDFVTHMYPDTSRIFKKDNRSFFLPIWAKSPEDVRCVVCDVLYEAENQKPNKILKCQRCTGAIVVAKEVATPLAELPWDQGDVEFTRELLANSRYIYERLGLKPGGNQSSKNAKDKSSLHDAFGHDQSAIEGFAVSSEELKTALLREKAERDAKT